MDGLYLSPVTIENVTQVCSNTNFKMQIINEHNSFLYYVGVRCMLHKKNFVFIIVKIYVSGLLLSALII